MVHAGPFANIAVGQSSIIADRVGLKMFDYHVTESGFAADIGFEKFWNIKSRLSGLTPNVSVIDDHDQGIEDARRGPTVVPGTASDPANTRRRILPFWKRVLQHDWHHIEMIRKSGINPVVCINAFHTDTKEEIAMVRKYAEQAGARVALSEHWLKGGDGALELADVVMDACKDKVKLKFLYPLDLPLRQRVETSQKRYTGPTAFPGPPMARSQGQTV